MDERITTLEHRVDQLETRLASQSGATPAAHGQHAAGNDDTFWALDGFKARFEDGVVFTGRMPAGDDAVEYQYGRTGDFLAELDWGPLAERLAALGHPIRLAVLQHLLAGPATAAELASTLELGSVSVAYHHLGQLARAGWVASAGRGRHAIPDARLIPLLAAIIAAES